MSVRGEASSDRHQSRTDSTSARCLRTIEASAHSMRYGVAWLASARHSGVMATHALGRRDMADPRSPREVGLPSGPDRVDLRQTVERRVHAGAASRPPDPPSHPSAPGLRAAPARSPTLRGCGPATCRGRRGVAPQAFVRLGVEGQLAQMGATEPDQVPVSAHRAPQPAVADVRHRLGDLDQLAVRRLDLGHDVERPLAVPAGKLQAVVEQPAAAPVAPGGELADDAVLGSRARSVAPLTTSG